MKRTVRVWAADCHLSLVENLKTLSLPSLDLRVKDVSQSGSWPFAHRRDPTRFWLWFRRNHTWGPYDYDRFELLARKIARWYGPYFRHFVDVAYVSFVPTLVHLYRYLGVKVLLHASYRLGGNSASTDLGRFLRVLEELESQGRLQITASNRYDQQYIRHFTGRACEVISVDCAYHRGLRYEPDAALPPLLGPFHLSEGGDRLADEIVSSLPAIPFRPMRSAYPPGTPDLHRKLCRHPYIVMIPYSVHCITITECLRFGIPLLFPSHRFLTELHLSRYLLDERKSDPARGVTNHGFVSSGAKSMPNPDDDFDESAVESWLSLCDWYEWPVIFFDSVEDLGKRIATADFSECSHRIGELNERDRRSNRKKWEETFSKLLA